MHNLRLAESTTNVAAAGNGKNATAICLNNK